MPINKVDTSDYNLIILEHIGKISDDEFLSFYKSFFNADDFNLSSNLLVDLTRADSSARSSEVLYQLATHVRSKYADSNVYPKIAVIAPKDVSFGLARTYEAFTDSVPGEFVVFRDDAAALAWLGLPDGFTIKSVLQIK